MKKKNLILLCGLAVVICLAGYAQAQDSDGDGVPDVDDACPGTKAGYAVDGVGCRLLRTFRIQSTRNIYYLIDEGGLTNPNSSDFEIQSFVRISDPGTDDAIRFTWTFSSSSEAAWARVYDDGTALLWDKGDVLAEGTSSGKQHDVEGGTTYPSPHTTSAGSDPYDGITITITALGDQDDDGVLDVDDHCPGTPAGLIVDAVGCADDDLDGVVDSNDLCGNTAMGAPVDVNGCSTATKFYPLSAHSVDVPDVWNNLADEWQPALPALQWGDFNNDGFSDMASGAGVYMNQGDGSFVHTASFNGMSQGMLGDWNNDGLLDFHDLVAGSGPVMYFNNGDGTFTSDTSMYSYVWGDVPRNSNGGTGVDLNGDGYLDTYMSGWWDSDPNSFDVIYSSYSDGVSDPCWSNTWEEPSPYGSPHMIKGVTACDFDEDGDQDVYASGYWYTHSFLWRNDGFDGYTGLTDVTAAYDADGGPGGAAAHTQGSCWADFDNDGHFDLFIANFAHAGNTQLRFAQNQGPPNYHFTDKGKSGVVQLEPLSCGIAGDYDNDGWVDILVTTSGGYAPPNNNRLYRNNGDWTFTEVTTAMGLADVGPYDTAAWGDYNNDGYLDLIAHKQLWRNPGGSNHWLKVKLLGGPHSDGLVNGAAIGAQVRIDVPGLGTLVRQVEGNTGQLGAQNDLTMHFGLGSHTDPVDLDITWTNGFKETIYDVAVDQAITVQLLDCALDVIAQGHRLDGDFDGNCHVDGDDTKVLAGLWLADCGSVDCSVVDLDGSATVDLVDFSLYSDNIGQCNEPHGAGCITNW